mmetsp:Transcript_22202/g.75399  ORF Transcript_22202/g.75399 Transcript_22202/m.75399 type:complete len:172 (-) Transcript_22202:847-1362(-)
MLPLHPCLPQCGRTTKRSRKLVFFTQQFFCPLTYRFQTVCRYWLRNLCMKGNSCSFLHQYDPDKMPICRFFAKYGECKEIDCPYSHASEGIKDCNMYKLGFCIHGPNCLFRHVKKTSPPPPAEDAALLGRPGFRGPLFSNQLALRQQGQTSLRLQSNNEHTAFTGSQTATI